MINESSVWLARVLLSANESQWLAMGAIVTETQSQYNPLQLVFRIFSCGKCFTKQRFNRGRRSNEKNGRKHSSTRGSTESGATTRGLRREDHRATPAEDHFVSGSMSMRRRGLDRTRRAALPTPVHQTRKTPADQVASHFAQWGTPMRNRGNRIMAKLGGPHSKNHR